MLSELDKIKTQFDTKVDDVFANLIKKYSMANEEELSERMSVEHSHEHRTNVYVDEKLVVTIDSYYLQERDFRRIEYYIREWYKNM